MEGREVSVLLDTVSSVSLMDRRVLVKLERKNLMQSDLNEIIGICNIPKRFSGKINVDVDLESNMYEC